MEIVEPRASWHVIGHFMVKEKFVVQFRRGEPLLVDKQILRWRKRRKKAKAQAEKEAAKAAKEQAPLIRNIFE